MENLLTKTNEELINIVEQAEIAKQILKYKSLNIVIVRQEQKKYKKNKPLFIDRIFNRWYENFIDEDTGDVIEIQRNECLGIFVDGIAYTSFILNYVKKSNGYELDYFNQSKVLTHFVNKII